MKGPFALGVTMRPSRSSRICRTLPEADASQYHTSIMTTFHALSLSNLCAGRTSGAMLRAHRTGPCVFSRCRVQRRQRTRRTQGGAAKLALRNEAERDHASIEIPPASGSFAAGLSQLTSKLMYLRVQARWPAPPIGMRLRRERRGDHGIVIRSGVAW
jgi:hypothetical protein